MAARRFAPALASGPVEETPPWEDDPAEQMAGSFDVPGANRAEEPDASSIAEAEQEGEDGRGVARANGSHLSGVS